MIKTETEYQECLRRLKQDLEVIEAQRRELSQMSLTAEEIERALEPAYSFHEQLKEEVEWYERVQRRDFQPVQNLRGLGQLLIALRIASGVKQAELARRLNVDVSMVSRDERNEYHGISIERAEKILNALDVHLVSRVEFPPVTEDQLAAV
jgi:ribosome-binding protein aMBF1 (putative translation factor)